MDIEHGRVVQEQKEDTQVALPAAGRAAAKPVNEPNSPKRRRKLIGILAGVCGVIAGVCGGWYATRVFYLDQQKKRDGMLSVLFVLYEIEMNLKLHETSFHQM